MNRYNAAGQAVDAYGNPVGLAVAAPVDASGQAVASVSIPSFDASGQIIKDASGQPILQAVPANSPAAMYAANAKTAYMHTPLGMAVGAVLFAGIVGVSAYAGTRMAIKQTGKNVGRNLRSAARKRISSIIPE